MRYCFFIKGETPAKKNSRQFLKNGKNIPSKIFRDWHEAATVQILRQRFEQKIRKPIETPCKIHAYFSHGDLRRRDCDNGFSSILDLLTDCKIIKDDNWQIINTVSIANVYEKNNAFCQIIIETHEDNAD